MQGRLIAIGDIHGCDAEFSELLDKLAPTKNDRVILLGDLVNRGPDSRKVVALARECGARSLLGNHELRLLRYRRTRDKKHLKAGDLETVRSLRAKDWAYLESMVVKIEEPKLGLVFVHGGFLPHKPWRRQRADVVTSIQVITRDGRAAKRTDAPRAPSWARLWQGPPFVIYGHTPRERVYRTRWSLGLDTGCVLGGRLTAYVLPEKRFIQVKARQRYWP